MHIEFGVKFSTEIKIEADLTKDNICTNNTPDTTKIYVANESEHIFKPKEGDIIFNYKGGFCRYEDGRWGYIGGLESVDPEHNSIIMRHDKQFFQAEIE